MNARFHMLPDALFLSAIAGLAVVLALHLDRSEISERENRRLASFLSARETPS